MKQMLLALFLVASASGWEPLPSMPEPNGGFSAGFVSGKLIVAGGTNWTDGTKHWLKAIRSYDPDSSRWTSIGELPEARAYAAAGVIHGRLVIAGGSDGAAAMPDVLAVSSSGSTSTVGSMEHPTIYSCFASSGDMLYVAGGSTDPADLAKFSNAIRAYRFGPGLKAFGIAFEHKLDAPGFGTGTLAFGQNAVLFGGAVHDPTSVVSNRDWIFNITADGVSASRTRLHHPNRGITAVSINDHAIYLAGGYPSDDAGFTSDAFFFDTATEALSPAPKLPISAMVHLVTDGKHVYCLGGEDAKKHRSDKMWRIPVSALLSASK